MNYLIESNAINASRSEPSPWSGNIAANSPCLLWRARKLRTTAWARELTLLATGVAATSTDPSALKNPICCLPVLTLGLPPGL